MPGFKGGLSRRAFLRATGTAGAGIALGGGLAGLLAGCAGSEESTTTSAVPTTATAVGGTTTTTAAGVEATTTSVGVQLAGEVTVGYVVPLSGAMADRGKAVQWILAWFAENAWKDGVQMADGKKYGVKVVVEDSGSDAGGAAQAARGLVADSKIALIGASGGAETVVAVRDVAEQSGFPCVTFDCAGDAWNAAQPEEGFKWSWHTGFLFRDMALNYLAMWDAVQTNKKIGGLYPDDVEGRLFAAGLPPAFEAKGYAYVDPGRYKDGTTDYTAIIGQFSKQGVEILNGVPSPADYASFWKQAVEQGFRPKAATMAGALLLPSGVEALGDLGDGQTVECWFHPRFPYTSSLLSVTPQQVCAQWEEQTVSQWTQPLSLFAQFEAFTDIVQRCGNPSDKNAVVAAVKATKITTVGGPVDWTVNPDPYSGFYNFCTQPITGGQWVKGTGRWPYDMNIVASVTQPEVQTTAAVKELAYAS